MKWILVSTLLFSAACSGPAQQAELDPETGTTIEPLSNKEHCDMVPPDVSADISSPTDSLTVYTHDYYPTANYDRNACRRAFVMDVNIPIGVVASVVVAWDGFPPENQADCERTRLLSYVFQESVYKSTATGGAPYSTDGRFGVWSQGKCITPGILYSLDNTISPGTTFQFAVRAEQDFANGSYAPRDILLGAFGT